MITYYCEEYIKVPTFFPHLTSRSH
jgi:hypothetical protein